MKQNKKLNIKKYISNSGEDIAHKHRFIEEPDCMPFYDGISSLVPFDINSLTQFPVFAGRSVIPRMKTGKKLTTLNLIDGKNKIFASVSPSIFHFVAEDMLNIISMAMFVKKYSNMEIIIDISGIWEALHDGKKFDIFWFFLKTLKDKKINHKLINSKKFDVIYIDNFYALPNILLTPMEKYLQLSEYLSEYIRDPEQIPYRKVYISRKKYTDGQITTTMVNIPDVGKTEVYNARIDDESVLEEYFSSLGFEIIYPEDFETFEDQLNFFYSVKTVASITSAGMTNQLYMKPGGNVIEIITPLIAVPVNQLGQEGYVNAEFHNYYKNIASSMGHAYIGIPNLNGKAEEFKQLVSTNKTFSNIIESLDND